MSSFNVPGRLQNHKSVSTQFMLLCQNFQLILINFRSINYFKIPKVFFLISLRDSPRVDIVWSMFLADNQKDFQLKKVMIYGKNNYITNMGIKDTPNPLSTGNCLWKRCANLLFHILRVSILLSKLNFIQITEFELQQFLTSCPLWSQEGPSPIRSDSL